MLVLFVGQFAQFKFLSVLIRIPLHFCNFEEHEEKLKSFCEIEHFRFNPMQPLATYSFNGQVQGG